MTRDDIVQMAHLAGLVMPTGGATENQWRALEIFAELATEKERNRIWTQDHWTEYEKGIAAVEREACAKVCENGTFLHDFSPEAVYSRACARAIRARGQA